jgi:hypothetical protein
MEGRRSEGNWRTCYHAYLLCIFSSDHEDDVPLAGVNVVVLEEEWLVNAILLESAEFDDEANSASQRLLNDQVLLATNLVKTVSARRMWAGGRRHPLPTASR